VVADAVTNDTAREPNPHLAFGAGLHFCLGAPLARMELEESLSALFARCPGLALAREPESRGTFVLRGFRSVPVTAGGRAVRSSERTVERWSSSERQRTDRRDP